ncbi:MULTISPECIES: Crp/Fnr family transcriptional regulator [Rhizobium]|uniref:Crp/Fnr family transcriptional regulator n=1 Tax=Rhizobium TaxID=379 RepID=UPI001B33985A|nr:MULTISPECIES: Crp/Fnr family transcriptional regulator [Rhizobium]MBX4910538.1 Crp/Fnr family transcriptional regulator [Rhizobium bangladeshense]MBX5218209.1 Crp/Fnr family transcriptional regulator [Rhizobium sp. NLR9a]MBX5218805.1 Crp/Fnr family transcriptional regulator [Rhizobium sp. NLR8a]MBX5229627.1 Crp/Fnr family transcriptional regulator [Rhizobium sp. NLR9b]MBX5235933.1 Crp/Fnr family transcriptional regulator [Rhizobium sp. NLR4a]
MDGITHASDRRIGISKGAISASGGIHLNSRIVIDDEFLSCRSSVRRFRRGEIIAGAGVLVDMFARVHSGLVSASTMLPDGREFIVEIIPKTGLIGELEVLRRQTLNLEYRASSNCELHFFEGRLLRDMYASDSCFREKVFSRALARVSELEDRIIANAASTLQARLASTLLRLSAVYGKDAANSGNEVIISQNDLAATLPASREKVNQCLRRLRECKIVDGGQGKIRILNRKALEACANGAFSAK